MPYFGNEPAKVATKVGVGVITATELADDSITTADIVADAITPTELSESATGYQVGSLGVATAVSGSHKLVVGGTASFSGAITGDLTGNVTGNTSGTSATVTGATQSAITSVGTLTSLTGGTGDLIWDSTTLVVDSSANAVGIGCSPSNMHEVKGDGSGIYGFTVSSPDGNEFFTIESWNDSQRLWFSATHPLKIGTATNKSGSSFSEKLKIDTNGDTTVSVDSLLRVSASGSVKLNINAGGTSSSWLEYEKGAVDQWLVGTESNETDFQWYWAPSSAGTKMRLTNAGNLTLAGDVQIKTSGLSNGTEGTLKIYGLRTDSTNAVGNINFYNNAHLNSRIRSGRSSSEVYGDLYFDVATGSGSITNVLKLDGNAKATFSGKVGTGGTPSKSLQVSFNNADTAPDTGNALGGGGAGDGLLINNTNETTNAYANLDFRAGSNDCRIAVDNSGGGGNEGNMYFIMDNSGNYEKALTLHNNLSATFSGTVSLDKADGGLYFKNGSGTTRAYLQYQEGGNDLVISSNEAGSDIVLLPAGNTALTLADDLSATFTGAVTFNDNINAPKIYSSENEVPNCSSGSPYTVFTASNSIGALWLVNSYLVQSDSPTNYHCVALVTAGNGNYRIVHLQTANNFSMSITGATVQSTQTSGGTYTIKTSITRLG